MPRIVELLIVFTALLFLIIPIAVTGAALYLALGSPVFFRQTRVGKDFRVFDILKYRTMTNDVDENGKLLPDEMRQTRFSKFIRRVRLDELPQILAIAKGDMALVGPRPLLPQTIESFGELGIERCKVRPGLTGWSQVNGNVNLTNAQKLKLDLWYVYHRSLLLDFKIIVATIGVVLFGENVNDDRITTAESWLREVGLAEQFENKEFV
ncbi:sugar transferase [Halocynthiibacter sp. C4]|uniref:sugar transferase n=1 Tax=Halocynthiibacter sp. C4 TaxID=2992758 RepID=UPI00237A689E|nr:sugar transferase [Halocynthiibacter sp. C4]MDE0589463.1 sugar transferase [Halocynthiibacter sp. C4]